MLKGLQSSRKIKNFLLNPTIFTLLIMVVLVTAVILSNGGDPLALARLGTQYSLGEPDGTQGYDGQFVYYIARDPKPIMVARYLDAPAYRYQRILLPILAHLLSLGRASAIPWLIAFLGILSQAVGTGIIGLLLKNWGVSRWYALIYGLWAGFTLAVRLDLPEPLAYALIAGAIYSEKRAKPLVSWILYGFALFAKEVTVLFVIASLLDKIIRRRWHDAIGVSLVAIVPYMIFQVWLWQVFGQLGIGSGGAMATSFEIVPFMGMFRIGTYSTLYLFAMLVVFGPAVILPSIWGLWASTKKWLDGDFNVVVLFLFWNALAIPFLPFSTFRETGGLLRFSCGLVLSVLLYCGNYRLTRIMNYGYLWLILNLFLTKS